MLHKGLSEVAMKRRFRLLRRTRSAGYWVRSPYYIFANSRWHAVSRWIKSVEARRTDASAPEAPTCPRRMGQLGKVKEQNLLIP